MCVHSSVADTPVAGRRRQREGRLEQVLRADPNPNPSQVMRCLTPAYEGAARGGEPFVAGTVAELTAIWKALVKVYGSREKAQAACRRPNPNPTPNPNPNPNPIPIPIPIPSPNPNQVR